MGKKRQKDDSKGRAVVVISPKDMRTPDENSYISIARKLTRPEVTAAAVIQSLEGDNHNINALVTELAEQVEAVHSGNMRRPEALLVAQAHTLDGLFSRLARKGVANVENGYLDAGERYLRLALKAQSQCRTTVESLAEIKNPRPVAFVRQANISNGPQQVNNGSSRAGEIEKQPSKLLEAQVDEWVDTGAAGATGGSNPALEAVGSIDRAEVSGGKGEGF